MMISHDRSENFFKERNIQCEKTSQRVVSSTNCIEGKYFIDIEYLTLALGPVICQLIPG